MVIALRVCLSATVATGLTAYGEEGKGPLAAVMVADANANGNEAGHRALAEKRSDFSRLFRSSKVSRGVMPPLITSSEPIM
jgi:hypothetical protein